MPKRNNPGCRCCGTVASTPCGTLCVTHPVLGVTLALDYGYGITSQPLQHYFGTVPYFSGNYPYPTGLVAGLKTWVTTDGYWLSGAFDVDDPAKVVGTLHYRYHRVAFFCGHTSTVGANPQLVLVTESYLTQANADNRDMTGYNNLQNAVFFQKVTNVGGAMAFTCSPFHVGFIGGTSTTNETRDLTYA